MSHLKTCRYCGKVFDNYWNVYCDRSCWRAATAGMKLPGEHSRGPAHPRFKGEGINTAHGRWWVWVPPELRELWGVKRARIPRARFVWNQAHPDDLLKPGEVIHHIDHDKTNDVPENLMKLPNQAAHGRQHLEIVEARRSAEARAKMSASQRARFADPEERRRLSEARTGRSGHPQTTEAREKIAAAKRGKPRPKRVMDAANAARLAKYPRRPDRACLWCGKMFRAPNAGNECCSRSCGASLSHQRRRQAGLP